MEKYLKNADGISINGLYYDIDMFKELCDDDENYYIMFVSRYDLEFELYIHKETFFGNMCCHFSGVDIGDIKIHIKHNEENIIIADMELNEDVYTKKMMGTIVYVNKDKLIMGFGAEKYLFEFPPKPPKQMKEFINPKQMMEFIKNAYGISINDVYYDKSAFMVDGDDYYFKLNRDKLEFDLFVNMETLEGKIWCSATKTEFGVVKILKKRNVENIIIADMELNKKINVK